MKPGAIALSVTIGNTYAAVGRYATLWHESLVLIGIREQHTDRTHCVYRCDSDVCIVRGSNLQHETIVVRSWIALSAHVVASFAYGPDDANAAHCIRSNDVDTQLNLRRLITQAGDFRCRV